METEPVILTNSTQQSLTNKKFKLFASNIKRQLIINNLRLKRNYSWKASHVLQEKKIITLAPGIRKIARKAYVNKALNMYNAQMNEAPVNALDSQLARIALKMIANQISTAIEPRLPFAQLIEKYIKNIYTLKHILNDTR